MRGHLCQNGGLHPAPTACQSLERHSAHHSAVAVMKATEQKLHRDTASGQWQAGSVGQRTRGGITTILDSTLFMPLTVSVQHMNISPSW